MMRYIMNFHDKCALIQQPEKDAAADVTTANAPVPTIGSVSFGKGDATEDGAEATAAISLPAYTSVGIYTYKFNEAIPTKKTAGVTDNEDDLYMVVTVAERNGKDCVAEVCSERYSD